MHVFKDRTFTVLESANKSDKVVFNLCNYDENYKDVLHNVFHFNGSVRGVYH